MRYPSCYPICASQALQGLTWVSLERAAQTPHMLLASTTTRSRPLKRLWRSRLLFNILGLFVQEEIFRIIWSQIGQQEEPGTPIFQYRYVAHRILADVLGKCDQLLLRRQ